METLKAPPKRKASKLLEAGSLLYHPVHGICRIQSITKEPVAGRLAPFYALVPNVRHRDRSRFVVAAADIETSGFHELVSEAETKKILQYLTSGKADEKKLTGSYAEDTCTWALAEALLLCARDPMSTKDQRRRQLLDRSVRGLLREFSFVLELTVRDTSLLIQKSLGKSAKINPSVLTVLAQTVEDLEEV